MKSFFLLIFIAFFSMTGCANSREAKKIKEDAINLAKEYYKEKYNEELNPSEYSVYRYNQSGFPLPIPGEPIDAVRFKHENEDYSIIVNLDGEGIADSKQVKKINTDLKKFIEKEYFKKNGIDLEYTIIDRIFLHNSTFTVFGLDPDDERFVIDYTNDYRLRGFMDKDLYYYVNIEVL